MHKTYRWTHCAYPHDATGPPDPAKRQVMRDGKPVGYIADARGDREIEAMVQQAVTVDVAKGIEIYDRDAVPARIRSVVNDRWGA